MGFDKDDDRPLVNYRKWTTKVNFWIVAGVIAFLAGGAVLMLLFARFTSE